MGGGDGGFDEHAGLLWLQRVRQYTLANGIAWVRIEGRWLFCNAHVAEGAEREALWPKNMSPPRQPPTSGYSAVVFQVEPLSVEIQ